MHTRVRMYKRVHMCTLVSGYDICMCEYHISSSIEHDCPIIDSVSARFTVVYSIWYTVVVVSATFFASIHSPLLT